VVELLTPSYDAGTAALTYDVIELDNYSENLTLGLAEEPRDLAALFPEFGSAHLFIDSSGVVSDNSADRIYLPCSPETADVYCYHAETYKLIGPVGTGRYYYDPCGFGLTGCTAYDQCAFDAKCNEMYADQCQGLCYSSAPDIIECKSCGQA
jgi:hypothetical protein